MFKPAPEAPRTSDTAKSTLVAEAESGKVDVRVETHPTMVALVSSWIWWTIFLPVKVPLECTKRVVGVAASLLFYSLTLCWSVFCVMTLIAAAATVYVPCFGERIAQLFLLPSQINRIP